MKIKHKKIFALFLLVLMCAVACIVYVSDYYHTDTEAVAAFAKNSSVQCQFISDGVLAFVPEDANKGFIFYPGAKVECTAYEPLMLACAEKGIACVLLEMPFNLAFLDIDAAKGIQGNFPGIENWYIGGHSLGGSMAASHLAENVADYNGLVLLGSYSAADLADKGIKVLSIYGSEDAVLNRDKYEENKGNLPGNFIEYLIEGGNHAGFGVYGEQEGDGEALISNIEQIEITSAYIAEFIK